MTTFPLQNKQSLSVWGLGRDTRSFLRWLREQGDARSVYVIDDAPATSTESISDDLGSLMFVAPEDTKTLEPGSLLIKSPGVPLYRPEIDRYRSHGVQITDTISLWLQRHPDCCTIGVTGTKGKSTSASMLAHLFTAAGQSVALAGNIGIPIFDVPETTDCLILELSSYQTALLSEQLTHSILLNCYKEHLDWHGSFARYRHDKFRMLTQTKETVSIPAISPYLDEFNYTAQPYFWGRRDGYHVEGATLYYQHQALSLPDIPLTRGRHTLMNIAALCTSLRAQGLIAEDYLQSLESFQALPHRLEHLGSNDCLHFINDSIATIPEAVMAALDTTDISSTALIIGGFNRGLDWEAFADSLLHLSPAAVIGLPETGHLVVQALTAADATITVEAVDNLELAVSRAIDSLDGHGTVLLSPGAPSYGYYTNYQERGDHFRRISDRYLKPQADSE